MTSPRKPGSGSINELNDDILLRIFDFLDYDDKIRLRRTCSRWKWLIELHLRRVRALRLGRFFQGGYELTSGLNMKCAEHFEAAKLRHRRDTGTLFNERIFQLPADPETQCYSIQRYDYLHRALKHSYQSITMLSLGRVHISYRLLIALTNNLSNLEHLELINCASTYEDNKQRNANSSTRPNESLVSLGTLNDESDSTLRQVKTSIVSNIMYNQHADEQLNVRERLIRSTFVKNCDLIREARRGRLWSRMRHLLLKECNLMNEFFLSLLMALTSQSLVHLEIDKNQQLTGEFLNYCGPQLEQVRIRHCPSMRQTFVDDLVKIRKLLGSNVRLANCFDQDSSSSLKLTTSVSSAALLAILFSA